MSKQWAKSFPGLPCTGTVAIRDHHRQGFDDQPFDRQIVIPAVAFSGAKHERENNEFTVMPPDNLPVKNGAMEIYNQSALDNQG